MRKFSYTSNYLYISELLKALFSFKWRNNRGIQVLKESLLKFFNIDKNQIFLFASGKMGLYIFLKSLNLKEEDEVILPGYTCTVVPNAVKYIGAKAVYADIDKGSFNISYDDLLTKITRKTKVIVFAHTFGIPVYYIKRIKKQFPNIMVIEDCAHTFGSKLDSTYLGLYGDASFFSFEYSKLLTCGVGGVLIVNNKKLIKDIKREYNLNTMEHPIFNIIKIYISLFMHTLTSYRYSVFVKRYLMFLLKITKLSYQTPKEELVGDIPKYYPAKLHPLLAYIASIQVNKLNRIIYHNNSLSEEYYKIFKGYKNINIRYSKNIVYARFPIVLTSKYIDDIIKDLKRETEFEIGDWFNDVVHPRGSFRYGYKINSCPNGEYVSRYIINFPINIHMTKRDILRNKAQIEQIFKKYKVI